MRQFHKKTLFLFLVCGVLGFGMSACTLRARNQTKTTQTKTPPDRFKIVVSKDMRASELTDAGEQLVHPQTFMLADRTFSEALEKDPNNIKAQFYRALLKQFTVFRGILKRIKPLVEKLGRTQEYNERLLRIPEGPLKKFLLDGKEDIADVNSAQVFLNHYVRSINYFREFLVKNPELNLTVKLNPYLYARNFQRHWGQNCNIINSDETLLEVECDRQDTSLRKVTSADLFILRQIAAAKIFLFSPIASYSLDGIESMSNIQKFETLPYNSQLSIVQSHKTFGLLRPDHVMNLWLSIAPDFAAAIRWAKEFQQELCPRGAESTEEQRKGFLFSKGLCLPTNPASVDKREWILAKIEQALEGSVSLEIIGKEGDIVHRTSMDPMVLARTPILDLKTLLPNEEPKCHQNLHLSDNRLSGIFPKGDAAEVMTSLACVKH